MVVFGSRRVGVVLAARRVGVVLAARRVGVVLAARRVGVVLAALGMTTLAGLAGPVIPTQALAQAATPACSAGTLVHTKSGPVCGVRTAGETSYLDIPYAAPPIGRLRWRPPQPVHPWTATYPATQKGPACPSPGFPGVPAPPGSENCLTLEVQKPAGARPGQNLPVMYEIHGGGFLGEAQTDNGANLVSTGPVIYVYVKYRLGILGFLADKALGRHSGDYGLQDQQAGLRWVKSNIARFGGNPHNVTIFGESAGGASVCDQVASPTARGLFEKGISISGFYNYNVNTVWWPADCKSKLLTEAQAQRLGARFAATVGCGHAAHVAACLRAVPVSTLLAKGGQFVKPFAGGVIGPIVNGTTLTMPAGKAFRLGRVNKVKLIIGVGRDEFNGGVYTNVVRTVVADTPAQYRQLVREQFRARAAAVMRLYPLKRFPSPAPFIAYRTIMADAFSVCPALASDAVLSRHIPVYAYQDDDADSPEAGQTQPLGGVHSGINRLIHDPAGSVDPNQAALENQVLREWTGFARIGRPTVRHTPLWPSYTAPGRPVMSYVPAGDSTVVSTRTIMAQHHCGFWDAVNRRAPWVP